MKYLMSTDSPASPPPDYKEAENPTRNDNAPPGYTGESPPSYESLFGKIRQMRDESDGKADFGKKIFGALFCGLACNVIITLSMLVIPISCIVFGSLYLGQCPREKYIPIYLIVAGVFGLFKGILGLAQMIQKKKAQTDDDESPRGSKAIRFTDGPISCFLLAWFIAGSVWVYRIYGDYSTDPTASDYCHPTVYVFAFWILTVQYILILLSILCCCISGIIVCCMGSS